MNDVLDRFRTLLQAHLAERTEAAWEREKARIGDALIDSTNDPAFEDKLIQIVKLGFKLGYNSCIEDELDAAKQADA